jgi:hypothetical protein
MHNDVVHTQEQNICQTWSSYVYRIKTGIKRSPLRRAGTLLPRNLCKPQKQKVALQCRATGEAIHPAALTVTITGLTFCEELAKALARYGSRCRRPCAQN